MDSDDFGAKITAKPYPKYEYQSIRPGKQSKNAFLEAISSIIESNDSILGRPKEVSSILEGQSSNHLHIKVL